MEIAVGAISQRLKGIEGKVGSRDRLSDLRCARLDSSTVRREDNARRLAVVVADAITDLKLFAGSEFCEGTVSVSHLAFIWHDGDGSNWPSTARPLRAHFARPAFPAGMAETSGKTKHLTSMLRVVKT